MKKSFRMLLEVVKREETENGMILLKESGLFMNDIAKITNKHGFGCYLKGYQKEKTNYIPTGRTYKIKNVDDIIKLTPEQFEFLIDDLREYCNLMRGINGAKKLGFNIESNNCIT